MGVAGRQHRAAAVLDDADVAQVADQPVVPPGHHLEHHGVVALGEHPEDRLPGGDDVVDLGGALVGVVGQRVELAAHPGLDAGALGLDQRRVEAAEPHLAGEVADLRVPHLGGGHQVVEHRAVGLALAGRRLGVPQPGPEQRRDHRLEGAGAAVRQEHAVQRRAEQLRGAVEVGDAVVGQRAPQLEAERLGQHLGVRVAGAQVGVEVLLRVAGGLLVDGGVVDLAAALEAPVAREGREVGDGAQDVDLVVQHVRVVRGQLVAGAVEGGEQRAGLALVDVVPEDEGVQGIERVVGPRPGVGPVGVGDGRGERGEAHAVRAGAAAGVVGVGLEPDEPGAALDLGVGVDDDLGDPAGDRGPQRGLELHALDDRDGVALGDRVAGGDGDRHHHGRGGRAHEPGLAAGDAVDGAVDLDEVVRALGDREDAEGPAADGEAALEAPGALDDHVDALGAVAVEHHAVVRRARAGDPQPVGLADDAHVDLVPHLVADLGTPALGGEEQPALLAELVGAVRLDRGGQQRDVDAARRRVALGHHPVEPAWCPRCPA